jgi:hypothetical protein
MGERSKNLIFLIGGCGCFGYEVMPLGLSLAPSFFKRFINMILVEFLGLNVI